MEVQNQKIADVDWDAIHSQITPSLYSPESLSIYENLDLLTITNDRLPLAIWPIPFHWKEGKKIAQRQVRLLPYHAPLLLKHHALDKRGLVSIFIQYLQEHYHAIDLPLAPRFHDLAAFSAAGIYVEWRNTHLFSPSQPFKEHISSKVRNHIQSAQKETSITRSQNGEEFDFNLGVITSDESHRAARKQLACSLIDKGYGIVFSAISNGIAVGQALVVHDRQTAYLFHTWFKKNSIRGIPSLLISTAIEWAFATRHLQFFDLEGSIIPAIDRFFASLGGLQTPYAYVQWCKDKQEMLTMVDNCLFLPLRLEAVKKC